MKNILILLIPVLLIIGACKERFSGVNFNPPPPGEQLYIDSTYQVSPVPSVEPKMVLLEDFTGVSCVNCPNADAEDSTLHTIYPGQIASICEFPSVQGLSGPPAGATTTQSFVISDASNNYDLLGGGLLGQLPEDAFDRKILPGQSIILQNNEVQWQGFVSGELAIAPPMNVDILSQSYNTTSGKLTVKIKVTYTSVVNVNNFISAAITEDSIMEPQKSLGLPKPIANYMHNHVLRGFIFPATGLQLTSSGTHTAGDIYSPGNTYIVEFSTYINTAVWVPAHCNIVAFVHDESASSFQVYQSAISRLQL